MPKFTIGKTSETRQRGPSEIVPLSAEQSAYNGDNYQARFAIDLDWSACASPNPDSEGRRWLKIHLYQVVCVEQVIWYYSSGSRVNTCTCDNNDCHHCVGDACTHTLTISTDGTAPESSSASDCRFGDTLKIEGGSFSVCELAIIGDKGKIQIC